MEEDLIKYDGVLWRRDSDGDFVPYCNKHRTKLRYQDWQTSRTVKCPLDLEAFYLMHRVSAASEIVVDLLESQGLKHAKIIDLDGIYTPILRNEPKPKDKRYSIQVEIDETKEGKKLVIYAADRNSLLEKTQVFVDPQLDKLTFDGTGDIHPNMIFSKVVAHFKDGKTGTLEQK